MLLVTIVVLISAIELLTKGWYTLILIPVSLILLPVEVGLQYWIKKSYAVDKSIFDLELMRYVQLFSLLLFYVSLVGFGDTQEVLLFGFVDSTVDSALTNISTIFNTGATILYGMSTVYLLVRGITLYVKRKKDKKDKK